MSLNAAPILANDRGWEFEPYRIQAVLALDVAGGLAERLATELPTHLERRVATAIGPAWALKTELASGTLRHEVCSHIATFSDAPPDDFPTGGDKLLLLAVRGTTDGYELVAREYDRLVQQWGMPIRRTSRQPEMLAEQLFSLVWQTVAPVARVEPDPADNRRVLVEPLAAALPRASADAAFIREGDVFLPVMRRTTRGGELVKDGVQVVPWTYVEAVEVKGEKIVGRVHSGTRQPFGARRKGRVEPLVIALRADPDQTILQLHSRTTEEKPLVGYEVFAQQPGEEATNRVGASDREGRVSVPPGNARVQMLFVKNGGQLLARLPVVPGAAREIPVPLPDDEMRLAAEARLAALREEVVDVVARRNILMARVRHRIKAGDFDAAQNLLQELDQLPGRSQFNLTLNTAARLLRSDDPQIQRRIDQLIQATQTVLTRYLDMRPVSQLHAEFREAKRK